MHCINTYCVMYTIINFIYIILLYIYYFKQYYLYIKYKKILYFIYIQYIIYHSMKSLIYFLILAIFWLKFLTYCLKSMLANSSIVALACPISPLLLISFRIFSFYSSYYYIFNNNLFISDIVWIRSSFQDSRQWFWDFKEDF